MIVYEIFDDGGSVYYATLGKAREALGKWYPEAKIEKIWLVDLPPQKLAVRLLNGEQFVQRREAVA